MRNFDFLCLGFAKCGTTTLHEILNQHKDIYLPIIKEPLYYYDPDLYRKGYSWYRNRFYPPNISQKCLGEINPSISLKGNNAKRIYRDNPPDVKLIFMMRNPVDRAFSDFKFAERTTWIDKDKIELNHGERFDYVVSRALKFTDGQRCLLNGPYKNIFAVGRYSAKIEEYIKYFGHENMKFIIFEEFIQNQEKVCKELFEFVGVLPQKGINYKIRANEGNRIKRSELCGYLYDLWLAIRKKILLNTPFMGERAEKFMIFLHKQLYMLLTTNDKDNSKMSSNSRKKLEDFYREDKNKLKTLTGKDLDSLWFK